MTEPLAFLLYENLLPGSQLTNRLRDLGYRVKVVTETDSLVAQVAEEKPIVAIVELSQNRVDTCGLIQVLRESPDARHLPVLAYTDGKDKTLQEAAHTAGATLIVVADGLLTQLPMLLERVLEVE
jgi:PleD family two-component response regulator